MKSWSF